MSAVDNCIQQFREKFPDVFIPPIVFNPKMRTTAGRIKYVSNSNRARLIELNPNLLTDDTKLTSTLLHELAHAAAWHRGFRGHGAQWRSAMRTLGLEPRRCHKYNTAGLRRRHKRVAKMQCSCRVFEITRVRLKKMQNGAKYRCGKCCTSFKLVA
jgi:SprT protein